jgi:hypothetical protein
MVDIFVLFFASIITIITTIITTTTIFLYALRRSILFMVDFNDGNTRQGISYLFRSKLDLTDLREM